MIPISQTNSENVEQTRQLCLTGSSCVLQGPVVQNSDKTNPRLSLIVD